MTLRIGACQTPEIIADVPAALATIESFAGRAGTDLLLFPEAFLQGYLVTPEHLRATALDLASPAFAAVLARLAPIRQTLVFGVLERRGTAFANTAVVVTGGRLAGTYRKTHLTPGESVLTPGDDHPVFEAGGVRFGVNICYDTQFPAAARAVADRGARVLLVAAQNMMPAAKAERWQDRHHEMRAERARETGMWLVSSDVTGRRGDRVGLGPTSVLDPAGRVVAQVPRGTVGMVTVTV